LKKREGRRKDGEGNVARLGEGVERRREWGEDSEEEIKRGETGCATSVDLPLGDERRA